MNWSIRKVLPKMTNVGRWGNGDVEIGFSDLAQLPLHYGINSSGI